MEWQTNMNNETKQHWIRKGLNTCQHSDLSFEELAVPWQLADYLLTVMFLVTSSSETGFVIQQPKGKSTFFIASYLEQVKKASQQVLMTGIIVNILALMKDHCISFNISLQRSTIKDQINVHSFEVQWNMYIMATFGIMKTWSL